MNSSRVISDSSVITSSLFRGDEVIYGTSDGHVKSYSLIADKFTELNKYEHEIVNIGVIPNASAIVIGTTSNIFLFDYVARKTCFEMESDGVFSVSKCGKFLAAGDREEMAIHIIELSTLRKIEKLWGHSDDSMSFQFSNCGKYLVSVDRNSVRWWWIETWKCIKLIYVHSEIEVVSFSKNDDVAVGHGDRVSVYHVSGNKHKLTFSVGSTIKSLCFFNDGTMIAVGTYSGDILFYDLSGCIRLSVVALFCNKTTTSSLCFNEDGIRYSCIEEGSVVVRRFGDKSEETSAKRQKMTSE